MTTTTALRIAQTAHVLADVMEAGVAAGLPEPYAIFSAGYTTPHLAIGGDDCFADVEAWAEWLDVEVATSLSHDGESEFCEAVAEWEGVRFAVKTNRRVEDES